MLLSLSAFHNQDIYCSSNYCAYEFETLFTLKDTAIDINFIRNQNIATFDLSTFHSFFAEFGHPVKEKKNTKSNFLRHQVGLKT